MLMKIVFVCLFVCLVDKTRVVKPQSHTKMQAVTWSIVLAHSSASAISYKKKNTDRCLSWSGEEVQVEVSE